MIRRVHSTHLVIICVKDSARSVHGYHLRNLKSKNALSMSKVIEIWRTTHFKCCKMNLVFFLVWKLSQNIETRFLEKRFIRRRIKSCDLIQGHVNVIKLVMFQPGSTRIALHPQFKIILIIGEILETVRLFFWEYVKRNPWNFKS